MPDPYKQNESTGVFVTNAQGKPYQLPFQKKSNAVYNFQVPENSTSVGTNTSPRHRRPQVCHPTREKEAELLERQSSLLVTGWWDLVLLAIKCKWKWRHSPKKSKPTVFSSTWILHVETPRKYVNALPGTIPPFTGLAATSEGPFTTYHSVKSIRWVSLDHW